MDEETTIAQGLHTTAESANYDAACKRVLSEKIILAWIMKTCLAEYKDCNVNDIAEKYIEGQPQVSVEPVLPDESGSIIHGMDTADKSVHEGTVMYDIRFRAIVPGSGERIALIINLEAQYDFYLGYPLLKRAIFYCARMISSQYGREFTNSHYEKIKKVYSIWICMDPPKYRENTITQYSMVEKHLVGTVEEPVENYDLLSVIVLCLGNPDEENQNSILRMLDVLFSGKTSEAEKRKILQDDYDIQMTQTMERKVSKVGDLSRGIREKSRAEGHAEGRVEGRVEGNVERGLSDLRNLVKNMGISLEQAMSILEVPEVERQTYRELLGSP